ncbi:MAG: 2-haloacid dehalogenase [Pseudohongiellaceae bacterium]
MFVKSIDQKRRFAHHQNVKGLSRRTFILGLSAAPLIHSLNLSGSASGFDNNNIKAITFDVFGTVVDWRGSIIREGQLLSSRKGSNVNSDKIDPGKADQGEADSDKVESDKAPWDKVDWGTFADAWRSGYGPAMNKVRTGEMPWTTIDDLHRLILDELIVEFGLANLSESERVNFNRAWHRLSPWQDAVAGLERMKSQYIITTLSNGNVSLLTNMSKNAGLPWDAVLSAELAGHYKPDPRAYLKAAELLDLEPRQILMVATHPSDLRAAAKTGLRTAYVIRPLERGPNKPVNRNPEGDFDIVAEDFLDLAQQLGV